MTATSTEWPDSPLDAVQVAFEALTGDPDPLTVDCDLVNPDGDLHVPAGVLSLTAVRDWLLAHPRDVQARDAVWAELVRKARLDGPQWVIAAVGMAMPVLRRYTRQLAAGYRGDLDDLEAEILAGFLAALRDRVDLAQPAPYAALCRSGWRAGFTLCQQASEYTTVDDVEHITGPRTPRMPYGHPDVLVNRAVRLGVIDAEDEFPWIEVRLGRKSVETVAAGLGITTAAMRMRLGRIDTRIAEALASGVLTGVASPQAAQDLAAQAARRANLRAASLPRRSPARPTTGASGQGAAAA
ncbi:MULTISPECIES: hypothetical protein [unclassified Micromonospora]|uniref:hypothetical protein n=1 Tax=unclassified Micromonospora TaxID=2617518 RepID=UPI001C24BC6C|nr:MULTISPECIES: hypothetical protein [unclassified Micromonospora]MBU8857734.1 hypothetical protein [Micromonospora sp. WMMB482]MDM4783361.1 hypothetical protein [Micromonospora sp. b486]